MFFSKFSVHNLFGHDFLDVLEVVEVGISSHSVAESLPIEKLGSEVKTVFKVTVVGVENTLVEFIGVLDLASHLLLRLM